jgi:hypothetical protein
MNWSKEGIEEVTQKCAMNIINMIKVEELYEALQEFRNQAWREGWIYATFERANLNVEKGSLESLVEPDCIVGGGDLSKEETAELQNFSIGGIPER